MLARRFAGMVNGGLIVSVLLVVASACSSPKFPYGTYANADGSSVMQFKSDGTYSAYDGGLLVDQGTFSIQGGDILWKTSTDCYPQGQGTYSWTYQNSILVFRAQGADSCPGRQSVIDSVPYHAKQ